MTTSVLLLPVDMPWVRLSARQDIIDRRMEVSLPLALAASVFSHDPPQEDQQYPTKPFPT